MPQGPNIGSIKVWFCRQQVIAYTNADYHQTSNISHLKSQHLNVSHLIWQLSIEAKC